MDGLLAVAFEAHHSVRNHHRRYEITVGHDLFGDWTVTTRYGRVGRVGQERRYSAASPDEARAVIRGHLLRRLSAPHRIGCGYRLVDLSAATGFAMPDWLPADVLDRFPK